jgi:eukaryotic-like serine/threonine-protein kinase
MNPNQSYPSTGEVIDGKYQIEKLLGEGGMGAVAKATHILRRAPVALKFMSPNVVSVPGAVERFLNEGVAASQIESDNVVHVFDVGKLSNGAPYLVMEYMEGHDLAEVITREGHPGLEPQRAVYFIVQALRGLQVAHDAGIIHRDMKPSNCFVVNKEGEADFVKLLDFGISKVGSGKSASLTQTNSALGTPLYMSPEQARSPRDVDLRSDLYSVGVILYELLTGRTPFASESGEFTEILFKLFTQEPPPIRSLRSDLSPELAAAVHKALARDPNDRYSTAAEFALALEPFADQRSTRVLQRIRTHQPGRGSHVPSTASHGSEPVAAFSKLALGEAAPARTNDMPGAPARMPAETQKIMQGGPATAPLGDKPLIRHSAFPQAEGSRVESAEGAVAATQYGGPESMPARGGSSTAASPGMEPGKSTDLGAARDTSVGVPSAGKRQSPLVFVLPAIGILAVAGAAVWKVTAKPPSTSDGTALTAEPTPPPPATATAPPTATVQAQTAVVADAGATLATTAAPPKKNAAAPPPVPQQPGPPQRPSDGKTHLKDIQIHE